MQAIYQEVHNQCVASAEIQEYAKKNYPEVQIGTMISLMPAYPYSSDPKEVGLAFMKNRMELYFCGRSVAWRILTIY